MTHIGKPLAATRRPGELGVHSLSNFVFSAPDLKEAETFHTTFGLDTRREGEGLGLYSAGHSHRWCSIIEGPRKQLHHLSFGLFEDDVAAFTQRLQDQGVNRLDPPPGFETNGIWFRDHEGTLIEARVAEKTSPSVKEHTTLQNITVRNNVAPKRSEAGRTSPTRLAHVLLFTSNVEQAIQFYTRVLGLKLSDRSGDNIAFLHGIHGSDHHLVAFVKSNGPGIHHTSWDVGTIHEVGLGAQQMVDKGYQKGWGLGRHVLGSNYFHYIRDPWGSYAEYSCDIDFIPSTLDWQAGDHDGEDAFYVWGPKPPEDFGFNYEQA